MGSILESDSTSSNSFSWSERHNDIGEVLVGEHQDLDYLQILAERGIDRTPTYSSIQSGHNSFTKLYCSVAELSDRMPKTVSTLPDEPLELDEVLKMDETYEYSMFSETEEVVVVLLLGDEMAHALGYDEQAGGWIQFETVPIEDADEGMDTIESAIDTWVTSNYGDELVSGELEMITPGQRSKHHRPKEVEMGLEPEYDCPECDYYATGISTSPQSFLDHLRDEHDYSDDEAFDVL